MQSHHDEDDDSDDKYWLKQNTISKDNDPET
jgi:hypothetical protein